MLKSVPAIAAIFTIGIIVLIALIVLAVKSGRRYKVTWKAGGLVPKSLCCNAAVRPLGWTQDGWTGSCLKCGQWQYLGDDFDNPPPGFQLRDARINSKPYAEPASGGQIAEVTSGYQFGRTGDICRMLNCDEPIHRLGLCLHHWDWLNAHDPSISRACTCPADERPPVCQHRFALTDCLQAYADEGEALQLPPQPNIGGEGNPDYQGPHYEDTFETPRFAPYDMIGEPIPGSAVIRVGRVAAVGPIRTEGQGDEDTGTDKPEPDLHSG